MATMRVHALLVTHKGECHTQKATYEGKGNNALIKRLHHGYYEGARAS